MLAAVDFAVISKVSPNNEFSKVNLTIGRIEDFNVTPT
jgi:hypothetical protein